MKTAFSSIIAIAAVLVALSIPLSAQSFDVVDVTHSYLCSASPSGPKCDLVSSPHKELRIQTDKVPNAWGYAVTLVYDQPTLSGVSFQSRTFVVARESTAYAEADSNLGLGFKFCTIFTVPEVPGKITSIMVVALIPAGGETKSIQ